MEIRVLSLRKLFVVDKYLLLRHDDFHVSGRRASSVVVEVKITGGLVEEKLARVVQPEKSSQVT